MVSNMIIKYSRWILKGPRTQKKNSLSLTFLCDLNKALIIILRGVHTAQGPNHFPQEHGITLILFYSIHCHTELCYSDEPVINVLMPNQ